MRQYNQQILMTKAACTFGRIKNVVRRKLKYVFSNWNVRIASQNNGHDFQLRAFSKQHCCRGKSPAFWLKKEASIIFETCGNNPQSFNKKGEIVYMYTVISHLAAQL